MMERDGTGDPALKMTHLSPETLTGREIGAYRIGEKLGAGGMGDVYVARDVKLERSVAVKVLPSRFAHDPERLRRFQQEARAASSLNHPHILVIHDFGEFDGRPFMVSELVEGQTVAARLQHGRIELREALDIALQVSSAIAAAHERGVIHRDIKPDNLMLRPDGYVKVLDFGLAKLLYESDVDPCATQAGAVLGTPRYMPPEQARGLGVDARGDVWNIAAVLYEMIAGSAPFEGATPADLLSAILNQDPVPLDQRAPEVPQALGLLVTRALAKAPSARFSNAREFHAELTAIRRAMDSGTKPPPAAQPSGLASRARRSGAIDSLAVLPFVNTSGDPDTEYFCDGVTESIIGALSGVPKLRVMARSTTFRYKGKDLDPLTVGRELSVRAVLTGQLSQRGDRVTMSLELVDVREGWRLWGGRYDTRLSGIFDLQETITAEVSDKLCVQLSGPDRTRPARQTRDVAAYQHYLRGRYAWNKRVDAGFRQAIKYFEQAIAADPAYSLAYSGLADCYALLGIAEYGAMPPREAMPKSKWAAQQALELDLRLAEAHTSLAHVLAFYDWNWVAAEREFLRAIELNPRYAFAHHWYAIFLAAMGRLDEAIASELRALELEPLSLIINKNVGTIYYYARAYDKSYAHYQKALELDADFARTHFFLGIAHHAIGRLPEAIDELRKGLTLSGGSTVVLCTLGCALAAAGRNDEAREVLDQLATLSTTQYVPAFTQALIHVGLREVDRAFEFLERACDERSSWLVSLRVEPLLDPIRHDPRFEALAQRVGLPPA